MKGQREVRTIIIDDIRVETRAVDESESRRIIGHAAVFDDPADLYWFREMIAPGAFADSIKEDDVRALWNHDPNFVLGRNKSGTLILQEDKRGLLVDIDPPDTQTARDLMISIDRGDVSQMSFAFETLDEEWIFEKGEVDLRILKRVKLYDVSPVTYPAYVNTDVALRSNQEWKKEKGGTIFRRELAKFKLRRYEK